VGRESAVDIVTRYELDGPGIESRWGARFSKPVLTGPAAHPASYTIDSGFSLVRVKRQGRGAVHPLHLVLRLKKKFIYTSTHPLDSNTNTNTNFIQLNGELNINIILPPPPIMMMMMMIMIIIIIKYPFY
jgi:hypothetical protein